MRLIKYIKKFTEKSFTIPELLTAVIIVAILVTLALTHYRPVRERSLDREAVANLRLIEAAERIYQMENNFYYPNAGASNLAGINTFLRLSISGQNWTYSTNNVGTGTAVRQGRTWTLPIGSAFATCAPGASCFTTTER